VWQCGLGARLPDTRIVCVMHAYVPSLDVIRLLSYVDALNRSGVALSVEAARAFSTAPPIGEWYNWLDEAIEDHELGRNDEVVFVSTYYYCVNVHWLTIDPDKKDVRLSALGAAVLAVHDSGSGDVSGTDRFDVVMSPGDPFDYVRLLAEFGKMAEPLLVDPYVPVEHLYALAKNRLVARVLTSDRKTAYDRKPPDRVLKLQGLVGAAHASEYSFELRTVSGDSPSAIHDRLVLPTSGRGLMLGGSLGAKQPVSVVTLTEEMTKALLSLYEPHWNLATPVVPEVIPPGFQGPAI